MFPSGDWVSIRQICSKKTVKIKIIVCFYLHFTFESSLMGRGLKFDFQFHNFVKD
jgi:hypothetical protein